jgi:cytochrome oxidase Cu insertion factor (SCO1/SenC/PrrC family)
MRLLPIARRIVAIALAFAAGAAEAQGVYATAGPWLDEASAPFRLESEAGTYTIATMAYGACQRVCSTSVRKLMELHALAERRHVQLNFLVFGLDPSADKPSDWATFRAERHLPYANLQFLSGTPAATRRIADRLGIHYWRIDEHTMHDFRIVLLSPAGVVVRSITHFDDDVADLLP